MIPGTLHQSTADVQASIQSSVDEDDGYNDY